MFDFRFNTRIPFPESGSREHFHVSGMRAIDFLHDFTPIYAVLAKKNFRRMTPNGSPLLENLKNLENIEKSRKI